MQHTNAIKAGMHVANLECMWLPLRILSSKVFILFKNFDT